MAYLKRQLAAAMERAVQTFPAVLVTGARQTGKTTLLREEFPRHRYLSLERPDVRARAIEDPVGFLDEIDGPAVLDEVQAAPDLLSYIKDRIDTDREPGRWLFSGSQTFPLMRGVTQTLAGRIAVLELMPFSVSETTGRWLPLSELVPRVFSAKARGSARAVPALADWLLRGGYPEPRANARVDRDLWCASYVQTYLERDVRDLRSVGDLTAFSRFLSLVAARTGTLLNMSELARALGLSSPTIKQWLSVLEASGVVYLLPPYHRNLGKRISKSPKLFLTDPGLATFLIGLNAAEPLLKGPSLGALVETAVVGEWLKAFRAGGHRPALFHFRSSSVEVDLVIEWEGKIHAIEIKATATPSPGHADQLAKWIALHGGDATGVVACNIDRPTALRRGIRAVPWHLAW